MINGQNQKKRILFLYPNARLDSMKRYLAGQWPDSSFFGLIQFKKKEQVSCDYLELGTILKNKYVSKLKERLGQDILFFMYIFKILRQDIIISHVGLSLLFLIKLLGFKKPKWVVLNVNLTNALRRNKQGTFRHGILIYALKKADKIVCLSKSQKALLTENGISVEKLEVIKFGVDKKFFSLSPDAGELILSVGRDNGRDYKTLVEAVRNLEKKVVIIGSARNFKTMGEIGENIQIIEGVDYISLREYYARAIMIVIPVMSSSFLDGSDCSGQTVMLDAMACGKPVIIGYRPWLDDYIRDGYNGVFYDPEDPDSLRKKIDFLLSNPEKAREIGINARQAVEDDINSEKTGDELFNMVTNL
jgi:glycosyltransferase involved in cell wall biosynthesis